MLRAGEERSMAVRTAHVLTPTRRRRRAPPAVCLLALLAVGLTACNRPSQEPPAAGQPNRQARVVAVQTPAPPTSSSCPPWPACWWSCQRPDRSASTPTGTAAGSPVGDLPPGGAAPAAGARLARRRPPGRGGGVHGRFGGDGLRGPPPWDVPSGRRLQRHPRHPLPRRAGLRPRLRPEPRPRVRRGPTGSVGRPATAGWRLGSA